MEKINPGGVIPGLAFSKDLVAFAGGLPIKTKSGVAVLWVLVVQVQMKMNNVLQLPLKQ